MTLKHFFCKSQIIAGAIVVFISYHSFAQYGTQSPIDPQGKKSFELEHSWEFGFSVGFSKFLTSINPNSDAVYKKFNYWNSQMNTAMTFSILKNFSRKFSAEFDWTTTKLSGIWDKNKGYPVPPSAIASGLSYPDPFKTGLNQFDLIFVANLNKIIAPNRANDIWYFFSKIGGGAVFLKEYAGLDQYRKSGVGFKYAILYGGGFSYSINQKIKIKLGTTWFSVNSDRLDGVHTVINGAGGTAIFNVKENYIYPYIGLTYVFGSAKLEI